MGNPYPLLVTADPKWIETGETKTVSLTVNMTSVTRKAGVSGDPLPHQWCEDVSQPLQGDYGGWIYERFPGDIVVGLRVDIDTTNVVEVYPEDCDDLETMADGFRLHWRWWVGTPHLPYDDPWLQNGHNVQLSGDVYEDLPEFPCIYSTMPGCGGRYQTGNLEWFSQRSLYAHLTLQFKKVLNVYHSGGLESDEIWADHHIDRSPAWLPVRREVFAWVLDTSHAEPVKITLGGIASGSHVYDADDWEDPSTGEAGWADWADQFTNNTRMVGKMRHFNMDAELAGAESGTWCPGLVGSFEHQRNIDTINYGYHVWTIPGEEQLILDAEVCTAALYDHISERYEVCELTDYAGRHYMRYTGRPHYVDTELPAVASAFRSLDGTIDPETGDIDTQMTWTAGTDGNYSQLYTGWWTLTGLAEYEHLDALGRATLNDDYYAEPFTFGYYGLHGDAEITNLDALGEPNHDDLTPPDHYEDDRTPLAVPGLGLTGAVTIEAASVDLVDFAAVTGWTPTNCTLTAKNDGADYLEVVATGSGAKFSRDFSSEDVNCQGARFAEVQVEGDADELTLTMATRTWTLDSDNTEIDLLAPTSGGATSAAQDYVSTLHPDDATPPATLDVGWGVGVYRLNTFELSGFANGKTYKLRKLRLIKKSAVDGGFIEALIVEQSPWIDNRGPAAGATDDMEFPFSGTNATADNWRQRCGILVIDGVLAGEFPSIRFAKNKTGGAYSYHEFCLDEDPVYPAPTNGFFVVSVDTGDLPDDGLPVAMLSDGTSYTTGPSLSLGYTYLADAVYAPIGFGDLSRTLHKRYRGRPVIRVVPTDGNYQPVDVRIYSATVDVTRKTNSLGYLLGPAINYAETCHVVVGEDDSVVDLAQRYLSLFARKAEIGSGEGAQIAVAKSAAAGATYVVMGRADDIVVKVYSFDTLAATDPRTIVDDPCEHGVGCCVVPDKVESLVVVFDSSGSVLRTASVDQGRTWSEPVSIATGSYPQIGYAPADLTEMCSYISGGKVYVTRKCGPTATWGTPIEVTESDDQPAPITPVAGKRGKWVMLVAKVDSTIRRYSSSDSGRTWALDE